MAASIAPPGFRIVERDDASEVYLPSEPVAILFGILAFTFGLYGLLVLASAIVFRVMGGDPYPGSSQVGWGIAVIFGPIGVFVGALLALTEKSCVVSPGRFIERRRIRFTGHIRDRQPAGARGFAIDHASWGTGSVDTLSLVAAVDRIDLLQIGHATVGGQPGAQGLGLTTTVHPRVLVLGRYLAECTGLPLTVTERAIAEPGE